MNTLTEEQRQLLYAHCRSWLLAATIAEPDYGLDVIGARGGGSSWPASIYPDLPFNRTWCSNKRITGQLGDAPPTITVTFTQIRKWVAAVPDALRKDIGHTIARLRAEQDRTAGWCYCPYATTAPNPHSGPCTRHHPTATQAAAHHAAINAIEDHLDTMTITALGRDEPAQLPLFGAAS